MKNKNDHSVVWNTKLYHPANQWAQTDKDCNSCSWSSIVVSCSRLSGWPDVFVCNDNYTERKPNYVQWNLQYLGIKNEFLYPSNSKIYEKGLRYNETSLYWGSSVCVKHDSKYLYLQIVSFLPIFFTCLRNNTTQNQLQRWRRKSYISTTKILMGNLNWKRYLWQ